MGGQATIEAAVVLCLVTAFVAVSFQSISKFIDSQLHDRMSMQRQWCGLSTSNTCSTVFTESHVEK